MSSSKPLIDNDVIDHNESTVKESDTQHDKLTSIRSVLTSTVHIHDDGEESLLQYWRGVTTKLHL